MFNRFNKNSALLIFSLRLTPLLTSRKGQPLLNKLHLTPLLTIFSFNTNFSSKTVLNQKSPPSVNKLKQFQLKNKAEIKQTKGYNALTIQTKKR